MRPRIQKDKVEFCYSTVVNKVNNSSLDQVKAELTRYNQRVYKKQKTQGVVKCVEFYFFGSPVQKPLDWIEKLEAAKIEYQIIYKWLRGESSKPWC